VLFANGLCQDTNGNEKVNYLKCSKAYTPFSSALLLFCISRGSYVHLLAYTDLLLNGSRTTGSLKSFIVVEGKHELS